MADEEKLKLGKGSAFVKGRLKALPQGDEIWEADFQALPKPIEQTPDPLPRDGRHGQGRLSPGRLARSTAGPRSTTSPRSWPTPCGGRSTVTPAAPSSSDCGGTTNGGDSSPTWRRSGSGSRSSSGRAFPASRGRTRLTSGGCGMSTGSGWSGRRPSRRRSRRCSRPSTGGSRSMAGSRSACRSFSASSPGRCTRAGTQVEDDRPDTLAEAMAALEAGLVRWFEEQGVDID